LYYNPLLTLKYLESENLIAPVFGKWFELLGSVKKPNAQMYDVSDDVDNAVMDF